MTEVLFDGYCGEPVAWSRIGDPVIDNTWSENGPVAVTEYLTPSKAISKYGPISRLTLGPRGGFQSVTFGTQTFVFRQLNPKGVGLYDQSVIVIDDPIRNNYECPICKAAPGEQCISTKGKPCNTHNKRCHGRSKWEIEQRVTT